MEYEKIASHAAKCPTVVVFDTLGLPTNQIQTLREKLREYGSVVKSKKKIMANALKGYDVDKQMLTEKTHLLFVDRELDCAVEILKNFRGWRYFKAGDVAPQPYHIAEGVLMSEDVPVAMANEKSLVACNVPVKVKDDMLYVEREFSICNAGDAIDSEAEKILKILKVTYPFYDVKVLAVAVRKVA